MDHPPNPTISLRRLDADITRAMPADRPRLRRLLRSIRQAEQAGKPFDRNLARLSEDVEQSIARRDARRVGVPAITFDGDLPITAKRDEIAQALRDHQVIVVAGETGSGKSTQLPKICLELGRGIDGMIGHTQPRRIAARSVAARIAEELRVPLGREVGFKVRFTDTTSPQTYIKLMTDGILLAESQHDRFLDQYDTIIFDEAHERSLNIDFLIGSLNRLLPRRPDLKLIITSATIDAARFAEHFVSGETRVESGEPDQDVSSPALNSPLSTLNSPPVIEVSGRTYPVDVLWRPVEPDEEGNEPDLERGLLDAVAEVSRIDRGGDILIFMPTERDIHETAKILRSRPLPGSDQTEILPLYARLTTADQQRVFQPHAGRRIVIATNVAESSLTVPGIRFVIDPGTARISRYSARTGMQRLPIEPVSRASADQRKGRCGRVGPGVCVRLYSEEDYLGRDEYTPPEIQRTNLAAVILQTLTLGFGDIEQFPFLDPPKPEAVRDGYRTLFELGAINDNRQVTELGRTLARLPVDPRIGRMVLAARDEGCLHEVLVIASALELQDPRERPVDKQQAADEAHAKFQHSDSDFLGDLKLWEFYHKLKADLSRSQLRKACRQNFLSYNRLREWADVYLQLAEAAERGTGNAERGTKGKRRTGSVPRSEFRIPSSEDQYAAVHRALLTGLLTKVAFKSDQHEYTAAGGQKVNLWPGSAVFAKKPKWAVAAELVETNRRYLRTVARINPDWIEPLAGHLVNRSYSEPHWHAASASAMAFEKVTLQGLTIVPRRRVLYGPIDPAKARELFIQHGLVEGEYASSPRATPRGADANFLEHNRQLLEEIEALQAKTRRMNLLRAEEARYEFYDRRIPPDVYDGPRFEKWRRPAERENPRLLFMEKSDLLADDAEEIAAADFPDALSIRQMQLPLDYQLDPGSAQDGVTLSVPMEALNQLDPHRLGWLVPGLLHEKVTALIKSLPKQLRTRFVPAPDTARAVLRRLRFGEGDFEAAVAAELTKLSGEAVAPRDFQTAALPQHLRMNVRVVDGEGQSLASGRDVQQLRQELGAEASASFAALDEGQWNRDGVTAWDFGDLPPSVEISRGGVRLKGYPTLIDRGDAVSLRLLDSPEKAAHELRGGLRRLFILSARGALKQQADWLPGIDRLSLLAATLPDGPQFRRQLMELIADRAFFSAKSVPRSETEFQQQVKQARGQISLATQDVPKLVGPLVQAYHETKLALERAAAPQWKPSVLDMRGQLAHLTAAGFLTRAPWPWLCQYPRYFRGIAARLKKVAGGGLPRDQKHLADIAPRWRACLERLRQHGDRDLYDPQLELFYWMLEEYRVSLFAQELGTSVPISAKRLDEQWAKVRA